MATDMKEFVTGFIGVIIGVVVAVSLIPTIGSAIADANLSGPSGLILGLLSLIIAVGIMLFVVKAMY